MTSKLRPLIVAPALAAGLLAAPVAAHADWYGHRGYDGGGPGGYGRGPGIVGGAILGLGAGAIIAGALGSALLRSAAARRLCAAAGLLRAAAGYYAAPPRPYYYPGY